MTGRLPNARSPAARIPSRSFAELLSFGRATNTMSTTMPVARSGKRKRNCDRALPRRAQKTGHPEDAESLPGRSGGYHGPQEKSSFSHLRSRNRERVLRQQTDDRRSHGVLKFDRHLPALPNVIDQRRTEACDAYSALVSNAGINDAG